MSLQHLIIMLLLNPKDLLWWNRVACYLLSFALIVQFFHYTEHVAQVYQHWWHGLPIKESGGILYFLNLEWNHLIFNGIYLILLSLTCIAYVILKKGSPPPLSSLQAILFLIGTTILIQGYHIIEHIIRVSMHLKTGCEPCPGILGKFVDGIYLHFTFNTIVFLLPLIAAVILLRHRPQVDHY